MSEYSGNQIKILKGLEAVRKRPGMYIGDTGEGGLHHLVYEAIDNSIDEAKAGHGKVINLTVSEDNRVTIEDFGRGIPVDYNKEEKKSALEIVFTVLHAGGKFDDSAYKISGGLHGVGASVINALSSEMQVTVVRSKKKYFQEYRKGIPVKDIEEIGKGTKSGTKVSFIPDTEIFKRGIEFKKDILLTRMKEICYLNSFLTINFKFKNEELLEINYPNGLVDFINDLSPKNNLLTESFMLNEEHLDIALTYKEKDYDTTLKSYINIINTTEGGSHLSGALRAITAVMQDKCKSMKITGVKREHIIEGLVLIVSTYYPEPNFEGQTKRKLDEPDVEKRVYSLLKDKFSKFIEENPKTTKKLVDKILLAKKTKEAEKRTRETVRKKELNKEVGTLPGKLTDCRSRDPEISEIYLTEGDSAGGSAKQGRNKETQAILPLKGKIPNVFKSKADIIKTNAEIAGIIKAIGTGTGKDFDISKIRYHKIISMTDADVDGAHIATLLLFLQYQEFKPIIEAGYFYISVPPLYRAKKGETVHYFADKKERDIFFKKEYTLKKDKTIIKLDNYMEDFFLDLNEDDWIINKKRTKYEIKKEESDLPIILTKKELDLFFAENNKNEWDISFTQKNKRELWNVTRFKGLGEMNPEQLAETAMNPESRRLVQVTMESVENTAKMLDALGGKDTEFRNWYLMNFVK